VSPSGIVYNQADTAGGVAGNYLINNPENGIWRAMVTNNAPSPLKYSIVGDTRSDITLKVPTLPASYPVDMPLLVTADLNNYLTPITNATVSAKLVRDDWYMDIPIKALSPQ